MEFNVTQTSKDIIQRIYSPYNIWKIYSKSPY